MAEKSNAPEVSPLKVRVQQAAKVMKITEEMVWQCLLKLGIEEQDEDGIALLEAETTKESDAKEEFKAYVKPIRFTAGWRILKGIPANKFAVQTNKNGVLQVGGVDELIKSFRPIHTYKDRELLEHYGPEASSEIIDELLRRSNGRPFIIYDGETIDKDHSVEMLRTARRHETKQYHVLLRNGQPEQVRLYRADEFPKMWLEECPIHHGTILTDGYCDKCRNTWKGIHDSKRVVVRVACDTGTKYGDISSIHRLLKSLRDCGSIEEHPIMDVPEISMRLKELQEEDNMPKLKKRLSASSAGKQDPLYQHRTF